MSYTLVDIRNRVLNDKLDDTGYPSGVVDNFINDTQRDIFKRYILPYTEKVFIGALPSGEYIFTFPSDYKTLQALKLIDPSTNRRDITRMYVPFRSFNEHWATPENNTAGTPSNWTLHANKLYLSRPTDQMYTLELYYSKYATKLVADADVPELPEEFEETLVLGAYYRVLMRNEDFDLAASVKDEYLEQLDLIVESLGMRQVGQPNVIGQPNRHSVRRRR